jgi:hypothetical protein
MVVVVLVVVVVVVLVVVVLVVQCDHSVGEMNGFLGLISPGCLLLLFCCVFQF